MNLLLVVSMLAYLESSLAETHTWALTCLNGHCINCVNGKCSDSRRKRENDQSQSSSYSWSCIDYKGRSTCGKTTCQDGVCNTTMGQSRVSKRQVVESLSTNCINGYCIFCRNGSCQESNRDAFDRQFHSTMTTCTNGQCTECIDGKCGNYSL